MNKEFLDKLFIKARSHSNWEKKEIDEKILRDLYDLVKNCPTSANSEPMRIVFLKSKESKDRVKPFLSEGNIEKTMTAPIVAIIAYDTKFYEHLPKLFPHNPGMKETDPEYIQILFSCRSEFRSLPEFQASSSSSHLYM